MDTKHITTRQYSILDRAFDYFNEHLFSGELPSVLITLQRKPKSRGYHHHEKFQSRDGEEKITEIALNPDTFQDRTPEEVLSTLAHEQVHLWQYTFSEPARKGYHDKEWARKMEDIGLMPSSTGEYGGKKTGQSVSHYIVEGGLFEKVCGAFLIENENVILVNSLVNIKVEREKKKTRWKYTCPTCMQNAWAKKEANIACGDCMETMIVEE